MKKTIIIAIVSLLLGVLISFGFFQTKGWYEQKLQQERSAGAINQLNAMYTQAKTGELVIQSIIVENGKIKSVDGVIERGEVIRLEVKVEVIK